MLRITLVSLAAARAARLHPFAAFVLTLAEAMAALLLARWLYRMLQAAALWLAARLTRR